MLIEINEQELLSAHAEFNQIKGVLIMAMMEDDYEKKVSEAFPVFSKVLNHINEEMKKHIIK